MVDLVLLEMLKNSIAKDSWLELLNDIQLVQVFDLLKSGKTSSEIIKACQYKFGIKKRAHINELLPDLVSFRTKALDDKSLLKLEEAQKNDAAVALGNRLRGLTSKVDAFGRLNWLVDQQTHRVLRLIEREAKTLPMEVTTTNIKMLDEMLHKLLKAQSELNLDEESGKITQDSNQKIKGLIEGFRDDGETMIQATQKLLELAEDRSLILEINEDGTYSIEKEPEPVKVKEKVRN